MALPQLERAITKELRKVINDKKADWVEWSTREVTPHEGEKAVFLPEMKVWVAYKVKI